MHNTRGDICPERFYSEMFDAIEIFKLKKKNIYACAYVKA